MLTKRHGKIENILGICLVGLMGILLGRAAGSEPAEGSGASSASSSGLEEKLQRKEAAGPSVGSSGSPEKKSEAIPDTSAEEETVFVAQGKAELIEAVGAPWTQGEGYLEGSGPEYLLRTVRAIGSGDFHLSVELTLFQVPRSGASVVLGERNHFGFSSGNCRLFVEGPLFPGGQQILAPTEQHISEGRRFRLEVVRKENQMRFLIDGQVVYTMVSDGGPIGQVTLRPWRSRMRIHQFTATGHILEIPRSGSVEVPKGDSGPKPASEPDSRSQAPAAAPANSSPAPPSSRTKPVLPEPPSSDQPPSSDLPAQRASTELSQQVEQIDVYVSGQQGYHTYRIPSVLVTQKGTVLAFCEGRKHSRSDTGDIDLLVKRSEDGGRTFAAQQVVWDDGANTCGNPCPVVDQKTGTIWLLMTHNLGEDTEGQIVARKSKGTRTVWITHSIDDGRTWSPPVEITQQVKKPQWTWYATGPGAGIQLRSGRLVIPCDHIADDGQWASHIIYSDDGGKSWQLGGSAGPKTNECEVVELADGRLLLNMRNYHRQQTCRAVAFSSDGGETWSAVSYDAALPEPICQASIRRYSLADPNRPDTKNILLFSNPADSKERRNLTLRVSYDEGRTWPVAIGLWPGPAAYSCLAVLPHGTVLCLYERGQKHPYERIRLARIPAKEIEGLPRKE